MFFHIIRLSIIAFLLHAGVTVVSAEEHSVSLEVLAPKHGDVAGVGSRAFLVDLVAHFEGNLASTGASPEFTGGAQTNQPPFPGTFGIGANLDHFPGLVVLLSSSTLGAGPGQNLANLFNIVAITDRRDDDTDVSATWIIGAPNVFGAVGQHTPSRLFVAVVEGPAPNVLEDRDGNGRFDEKDLRLMGFHVISNVKKVSFIINGL
ncbi:MAG: hypothetical protein ACREJ6_12405 [Candidatus Methylomirabilis sp.]